MKAAGVGAVIRPRTGALSVEGPCQVRAAVQVDREQCQFSRNAQAEVSFHGQESEAVL